VIDKGLMDAIVCRAGGQKQVLKYVGELERITKDDGVFVIISRGLPEERLQFLEQFDLDEPGYTPWIVDVQALCKSLALVTIRHSYHQNFLRPC
jgi:hypothetical protein